MTILSNELLMKPGVVMGIPEEPKEPLCIMLREGDLGPVCPQCQSSRVPKLIFWRKKVCINPDCDWNEE